MTTPTEYLRTVLARAEAATKGKWESTTGGFVQTYVQEDAPPVTVADSFGVERNASFIAHARDDVPALVKMLEVATEYIRQEELMEANANDTVTPKLRQLRGLLAKLQALVPGEKR